MPSFEMRNIRLADASTRASSSATIAWVTRSAPLPPYASGNDRAVSSIALNASNDGHEYSSRSSASAARGASLSSANWRTTARNSRCSSLRVIGWLMGSVCTWKAVRGKITHCDAGRLHVVGQPSVLHQPGQRPGHGRRGLDAIAALSHQPPEARYIDILAAHRHPVG